MNGLRRLAFSVSIGLCALVAASDALAYDGRLLDGVTGKPVPDVWVIGRWETGGGFVHGGSGCVLAITKTDPEGKFTVVSGDSFIGRLFGLRVRPSVELYKRGVRQRFPGPDNDVGPFYVDPEKRAVGERLDDVVKMLSHTDCGTEYRLNHKSKLLPLYREMNAEAQETAKSPRDRESAVLTQRSVDLVQFGSEEADRRARAALDAIR